MKSVIDTSIFKKWAIKIIGKPLMRRFVKSSKNISTVQQKLLMKIINDNRDTVFGKKYEFCDD